MTQHQVLLRSSIIMSLKTLIIFVSLNTTILSLFFFNEDEWIKKFGNSEIVEVIQSRDGVHIWTGKVQVKKVEYDNILVEKAGDKKEGDWKKGDIIMKAELSFLPNVYSLRRGNEIVLPNTINPSNEFSFKFKLQPFGTRNGWSNILRFTTTTNERGTYGDRWLALWFHPNSYTLHVVAGTTIKTNQNINVDGVQQGIRNDIEIRAIGNDIKVFINGNHVGTSMSNKHRPSVTSLRVYASDGFYEPADAELYELSFTPW